MSTISSIMVIVRMTSFSSSQVQLLFRIFAATLPSADRTGLLSAEKCRRHLSAGTDSGRAGVFYHISTSCSRPAEESLLSCCYIGRIFSKRSCVNAPGRCTLNRRLHRIRNKKLQKNPLFRLCYCPQNPSSSCRSRPHFVSVGLTPLLLSQTHLCRTRPRNTLHRTEIRSRQR